MDKSSQKIQNLAQSLVFKASQNKLKVACAESCTGGLLAAAITAVAGSSAIFEYGVVSYSNEAKTLLLNVAPDLISKHGAVSLEVAMAMVAGLCNIADINIGAAITGIAGPAGGSIPKPVGTVYIATYCNIGESQPVKVTLFSFQGDREKVRLKAVLAALNMMHDALEAS